MCTRRGLRSRGFHSSVNQARTKGSRVDRSGRQLHRACHAKVRLCRRHRWSNYNRVGGFAVPHHATIDLRLIVVGRAHCSERRSADLVAEACPIGSGIGKHAAVPVLWAARCSAARSQIQIGEPNGSSGVSSDGLASQCDVAATVGGLSCGTMCGKRSSKSWRCADDDRHARLGDQKES